MGMLNMSKVTRAVQQILEENLRAPVFRNKRMPLQPNNIQKEGWVCVYKGRKDSEAYRTGSKPWKYALEIPVFVIARGIDGAAAENNLEALITDIETVLFSLEGQNNLTLGGNVSMVMGWSVEYQEDYGQDENKWQLAIITLKAEALP